MTSTASEWRERASSAAMVAAAVSVVVLVIEGPPGNGYGWGSVALSAGILTGVFMVMAYLVRSSTPGRAVTAAALAVLVAVFFVVSLIGNWSAEPVGFRALDMVSTLVAVSASSAVFLAAVAALRHSRSAHAHTTS